MFKKFFTIAAAAVVVAGCGKETVSVKDGASQLKPIAFTSYTQGEVKADVTADNLTTINVLAEHKATDTPAKYFYEAISLSGGKGTSSAYWPSSGTMYFYASNSAISDAGVVTVGSVANDVVVASKTEVSCPGSGDVSLAFSHIFAKFVVTAKVDSNALKATISKIEVVAKAPVSYDVKASAWTTAQDAGSSDYYTGTKDIVTTTADTVVSGGYVAPQEGVAVNVYYKLTNTDGDITYADSTANPAKITGLAFTEGKKHTLNLTFDAAKIAFEVTQVADFGDGGSTNKDL